jgi:hypothetical protein
MPHASGAQSIGTFRWQQQPYCNVISVLVTQASGVFTLDGFDDQCGAATRAPVTGVATPNPNGTVELGFNIVASPSGAPVHVATAISITTLGGTWRDSTGATGNFVFTPGAGTGGSSRPAPSATTIPASIGLFADGQLIAQGALNVGNIPASGAGVRMMWHPAKAAFRAGQLTSAAPTAWDDLNLGVASIAFGFNTQASGVVSTAFGAGSAAVGQVSTAMGIATVASGNSSTAMGDSTTAIGISSTAMGRDTRAQAELSTAMGGSTIASGYASTVAGVVSVASGVASLAVGDVVTASGDQSVAFGSHTTASGARAFAMGFQSQARGIASVALGSRAITEAAAHGSFVFADQSSVNNFTSPAPNEFGVRAAGGVYLYTRADLGTRCIIPGGSAVMTCTSDRNSKERFEPVDGELVLSKLRSMPIERWSYRSEPGVVHVGPVAQDFHAAFGLGVDDKTIGHLDLSGISLRAIQALEARTRALIEENAALRKRLEHLERIGATRQ